MFLLKSFIAFTLPFRFLIHFELMFVCGVRKGSNFILVHVNILECSLALCFCVGRKPTNVLALSRFLNQDTDHFNSSCKNVRLELRFRHQLARTESHSNKPQGTLKSSWWLFSAQFRGFGLCAKERHYRPGWRHLLGRWRFWQMEILAGMALGWQGSCSNESWERRWITWWQDPLMARFRGGQRLSSEDCLFFFLYAMCS